MEGEFEDPIIKRDEKSNLYRCRDPEPSEGNRIFKESLVKNCKTEWFIWETSYDRDTKANTASWKDKFNLKWEAWRPDCAYLLCCCTSATSVEEGRVARETTA